MVELRVGEHTQALGHYRAGHQRRDAPRTARNRFEARFATAAALIEDLSTASRQGRLRTALAAYTQPHVLVIEEVGYLTYGPRR